MSTPRDAATPPAGVMRWGLLRDMHACTHACVAEEQIAWHCMLDLNLFPFPILWSRLIDANIMLD